MIKYVNNAINELEALDMTGYVYDTLEEAEKNHDYELGGNIYKIEITLAKDNSLEAYMGLK